MRGIRERLLALMNHSDALLAGGVLSLILLLIIPLPPLLLDTLLCLNIVFSVMVLLLTLYVESAMEFSSFPSLLLFLTLYRLGLNIASTRMILTHGEGGDIIQTFGSFVTQNNTLVGLILFALLTVINFIVVTKGAGRVAEVAARFTLEALPGKQSAIDAELQSGLLDQTEARKERDKVGQEAEFYGAMDGASKFVRGDAIAGIIITLVNVMGGFVVGFFVKEFSWKECWTTFTCLTVGDGLVSQIPALLVSIGAGILVTRASSESLGKALTKQMFNHPKVLLFSGILVLLLSLVPGMPLLVMVPMGSALLFYAILLLRNGGEVKQKVSSPIEISLGVNLAGKGEELHQALPTLRKTILKNVGIHIGKVTITDSMEISPNCYALSLRGIKIHQGREREVDAILSQLEEVFESHAHELITRQDVARLIEEVRRNDAAAVNELKLNHGQVLSVVQALLKERIPITDFTTILELLATPTPLELPKMIERVREGLAHTITDKFFGQERTACVITIDPKVEKMLDVSNALRPRTIDKIAGAIEELLQDQKAVVLTAARARPHLRTIMEKRLPKLPILAYSEVDTDVQLDTIGTVSNEVLL